MISIEEAFKLIDENVVRLPTEQAPLSQTVGRVLASNVKADVDSPPHDKSVMDGFAVRSADVAAGDLRLKVVETIIAGGWPTKKLGKCESAQIMTGAPLPEGADAVVMVEQTEVEVVGDDRFVHLKIDSLAPEKHVLRRGVNFGAGQAVFAKGHVIRPTDIGLLAEVGAHEIESARIPSVAVMPTGNELVDCRTIPGQGQIRNSNGPMLIAMAKSLGLNVSDLGVGRDEPIQLRGLIEKGLSHDLLLLSGGVSAGTMDLVPGILKELGVEQVFHKVFVKPGKPIWFGVLENGDHKTIVFGLPGNPVSSLVGFQLFVRAAIRKLVGDTVENSISYYGELTEDHQTRGGRPTYWPARCVDDLTTIRKFQPLIWRGSSDLFALGEADGLIFFPGDSDEHPVGEQVRFFPFA